MNQEWHQSLTLSCLLASESLVCLVQTNQLIIKLLHTVQRHLNIPEKSNQILFRDKGMSTQLLKSLVIYIPTCSKIFIVSSRTTDSFRQHWAVIQNFLLINFCDYCHHSMHTITVLAIGVGLKKKKKTQTIIPANMARRRSSITAADRLRCICLPHAPHPFSHLAQLNKNRGGSSEYLVSVCRNGAS